MLLAQDIQLPGGQSISGPLNRGSVQFTDLASVVNQAMTLIFPIAGLILFLYLIWGGFDYLTSMGDPKKAESGKAKITNAVIGFIIIFASYWIVQLLDYVLKLRVYKP